MLNVAITPDMLAADEHIRTGNWNSEADTLPVGYVEVLLLMQRHAEIPVRLTLPAEVPQILIRVNGIDGAIFFPEEAVTASLHPKYKDKAKCLPGPPRDSVRPQSQPKKDCKDSPYMIARAAEKLCHDTRLDTDTLRDQANTDRYDEKKRQCNTDYAERRKLDTLADEALALAASNPRAKKYKSKHRVVDNRKSNTQEGAAPAPEEQMIEDLEGECNEHVMAPDCLVRACAYFRTSAVISIDQ
ncbi:hypothetical protein FIBSPDRAFT_948495 [Athelia psychrophila]|uniref:Uncharacterized protein n=1 Tax=Athelia psychrophila TaxID=1759441 RepID=A0A166QV22_9AGAM|nr:hypothetical protein FIBSPDRAFT_948495 [Fibularhizoctonia sp. CBS 109695]